jgi:hypothetical protein
VPQTKSRMITVRVSEEEFESLRTITHSMGYRSLSDLARAAMHSVIGDKLPPETAIATRLETFDARITRLGREIERLSAAITQKPHAQ